jgi:all-trans-retinol 13,14-reductase
LKAKRHQTSSPKDRGFSMKKVPENLDVIVIGSGMGGLTVANLLARQGKKVLVLEQHDKLGGCTHSFEEKGYEFDSGLHYVGANVNNPRSLMGFVFHLLSLGKLKWKKLENIYDLATLSSTLTTQLPLTEQEVVNSLPDAYRSMAFEADLQTTKNHLKNKFPRAQHGIDRFYTYITAATAAWSLTILLKVFPYYWAQKIRIF